MITLITSLSSPSLFPSCDHRHQCVFIVEGYLPKLTTSLATKKGDSFGRFSPLQSLHRLGRRRTWSCRGLLQPFVREATVSSSGRRGCWQDVLSLLLSPSSISSADHCVTGTPHYIAVIIIFITTMITLSHHHYYQYHRRLNRHYFFLKCSFLWLLAVS